MIIAFQSQFLSLVMADQKPLGAEGVLFISQLVWLQENRTNAEGWIEYSLSACENETGLTPFQQRAIRDRLIQSGHIAVKRGGERGSLWIRVCLTTDSRSEEIIHLNPARSEEIIHLNPARSEETSQLAVRSEEIIHLNPARSEEIIHLNPARSEETSQLAVRSEEIIHLNPARSEEIIHLNPARSEETSQLAVRSEETSQLDNSEVKKLHIQMSRNLTSLPLKKQKESTPPIYIPPIGEEKPPPKLTKTRVLASKPETEEEAISFVQSRGGSIADGEAFHAHFEARGWRTKEGLVRDWQAAARGWVLRAKKWEEENKTARSAQNRASPPLTRQAKTLEESRQETAEQIERVMKRGGAW